jgi:hypothetical protein
MPLPNFIIVGECKCGTTSLFDDLIQHPDISGPTGNGEDILTNDNQILGQKEVRFFDKFYNKGLNWYENCFPNNKITGEASPTYLFHQEAIYRIHKDLGNDTKIIVMLRDPTERLVSHYSHIKTISKEFAENYPTFEYYWKYHTEEDSSIIKEGIYAISLSKLLSMFDNVEIVKSELFFSNQSEICNIIFRSLGLNTFNIENRHLRKTEEQHIDKYIINEIQDFYSRSNNILNNFFRVKL